MKAADIQQVVDGHEFEVRRLVSEYRSKIRIAAPNVALGLVRERNKVLAELLANQERVLAFHCGEKVEPKTQFGEAVIVGEGLST